MNSTSELIIHFGTRTEALERAKSVTLPNSWFSIRPIVEIKRKVDRETFYKKVGSAPCYWMIQSPPVETEYSEVFDNVVLDNTFNIATDLVTQDSDCLAEVIPIDSVFRTDVQERIVYADLGASVFSLAGGA